MSPRPDLGEAADLAAAAGLDCCLSPLLLTDHHGQILQWNSAAASFFGLRQGTPCPLLPALFQGRLADQEQASLLRRQLAHPPAEAQSLRLCDNSGQAHDFLLRQRALAAVAPEIALRLSPRGGMVVQLDEVSKLAADLQHKVARGESDAILDLLGTTLSDLEYPLGALRWLADLTPEALEESIAAPGEIRRQLRPVQRAARHLVGLFDNLSFPDDLAPGDASEAQVLRVLAIGTTPPRAAHLIDRLRREGLHLQFRAGRSQEDILRAARTKEVDVLLVDRHLPAEQAESLREALQQASCPLPLVFVQEDSAALAKEIRRSTSSSEMVGSRDQVWRRLEELALRDSMTGVLNRRAFERFGTQEFDRAKRYDFPLSLAFFDLDYFKLVNDRLGHAAGDRMLQVFASYLLTATRQTDLVARLGGDEFAVLMSHTDGAGALILTQRLRDAVEFHLREVLPPMDPLPGVSVGLAVFPGKDIQEFQGLLAAADQALYRAKRAGRGRLRAD